MTAAHKESPGRRRRQRAMRRRGSHLMALGSVTRRRSSKSTRRTPGTLDPPRSRSRSSPSGSRTSPSTSRSTSTTTTRVVAAAPRRSASSSARLPRRRRHQPLPLAHRASRAAPLSVCAILGSRLSTTPRTSCEGPRPAHHERGGGLRQQMPRPVWAIGCRAAGIAEAAAAVVHDRLISWGVLLRRRAAVGSVHGDDVLDAHAEPPGQVDAGLDREAHAGHERWRSPSTMYGGSWVVSPMPCPTRWMKYSPYPASVMTGAGHPVDLLARRRPAGPPRTRPAGPARTISWTSRSSSVGSPTWTVRVVSEP